MKTLVRLAVALAMASSAFLLSACSQPAHYGFGPTACTANDAWDQRSDVATSRGKAVIACPGDGGIFVVDLKTTAWERVSACGANDAWNQHSTVKIEGASEIVACPGDGGIITIDMTTHPRRPQES